MSTTPPMRPSRSRFTIERLRSVVLIGGVLLVVVIGIFLAAGQWKLHRFVKDIPHRLGVDIQQQADGVNYTQSRKGKTLFKIHAARAVKMKKNGQMLLHDVRIELYGEDGKSVDTISGSEFEYDPEAGLARAAGAVEITLMRPGVAPAIAQLRPGAPKQPALPTQLATEVADNEIHVKTSGLTFDQKRQVATTSQRVDFTLRQGSGSSTGATYDSSMRQLILDRAVELHVNRDQGSVDRGPVTVHAGHAEFERSQQLCTLTQAQAEYTGGIAQAARALLHFRDDGTIERLDGAGGVDLRTRTGSHLTAPTSTMDFDEHNQPRHGLLQGGAKLDVSQPNRQMQGTAPVAHLDFGSQGQLRQVHLERGVLFTSQQSVTSAKGVASTMKRSWKSQTADIAFAEVPGGARKSGQSGKADQFGQVEPRTIHGAGNVLIASEVVAAGSAQPATSQLSADAVVAEIAPGGVLSSLSGTGHAAFEQQTAQGARQSSSSDQLDVRFVPGSAGTQTKSAGTSSEIASVVQIGHVVLIQDATPARGSHPATAALHATAARSDYDAQAQLLHLSGSPRIQNGGLDLTASRIDFARVSGDALAHGDVKASWIGGQSSGVTLPGSTLLGSGAAANGPAHAIAAEAELHQATQEIIFRSPANVSTSSARIWQAGNSVSAPIIVLNRLKQTLTAESSSVANPVRTVLVGNSASFTPKSDVTRGQSKSRSAGQANAPSIIRLRSGQLHYSEGERIALLHGGSAGTVVAETTDSGQIATVVSDDAEVRLLPVGARSGHAHSAASPSAESKDAASSAPVNSTVDRITANGHVSVNWPGRKGTGEKLVYAGDDAIFTLTGTSTAPPRIVDATRGTVTGNALIFHSRDDSVTVEGDGARTTTETHARK